MLFHRLALFRDVSSLHLFGFEYVIVDLFTITKEKCSGRVIMARNGFLEFFRKFYTPKTLNFAGFHLWIALNLLKYAYSYLYSFFLQYPLSGNLKIYWWGSGYQCQVGSKWLINISINLKTKLLFMLIYACTISYRLVECPYRWMKIN